MRWLGAAGRFGIGTDSNLHLSVAGELRLLEWSQRLSTGRRNVIADRYREAFAGWPIRWQEGPTKGLSAHHLFVARIPADGLGQHHCHIAGEITVSNITRARDLNFRLQ